MSQVDEQDFNHYVVRLNGRVWGLSLGILAAIGLFVATVFLVIKGGDDVGQHLSLLSIYFPGYSVTVGGAVLGFIYAFVVGYAVGRIICVIYNLAAKRS